MAAFGLALVDDRGLLKLLWLLALNRDVHSKRRSDALRGRRQVMSHLAICLLMSVMLPIPILRNVHRE